MESKLVVFNLYQCDVGICSFQTRRKGRILAELYSEPKTLFWRGVTGRGGIATADRRISRVWTGREWQVKLPCRCRWHRLSTIQHSHAGHYAENVVDCVHDMSLLLEREGLHSGIHCLQASSSPFLSWYHLPFQIPTVFRRHPVKQDLSLK